jgi:hypothetical protein
MQHDQVERSQRLSEALLTVMMWTVVLPPDSNPFMDDHLIYGAVLIVLALLGAGEHPRSRPNVGIAPAGTTCHLAEVDDPPGAPSVEEYGCGVAQVPGGTAVHRRYGFPGGATDMAKGSYRERVRR